MTLNCLSFLMFPLMRLCLSLATHIPRLPERTAVEPKSATSDSDAGMVQHSEMWFDDGTIIIQAEDTQFRVYKGTLCRVSSVLREQVESMEALKDKNKCPIFRLVDSATDVARVLRAIFDRWYVYLFVSSVAFNALMPFIQVLPRH